MTTMSSDCIGRKPRLVVILPTLLQTKLIWIGEAPEGSAPGSRFGIQPGKSSMTLRARALAMLQPPELLGRERFNDASIAGILRRRADQSVEFTRVSVPEVRARFDVFALLLLEVANRRVHDLSNGIFHWSTHNRQWPPVLQRQSAVAAPATSRLESIRSAICFLRQLQREPPVRFSVLKFLAVAADAEPAQGPRVESVVHARRLD